MGNSPRRIGGTRAVVAMLVAAILACEPPNLLPPGPQRCILPQYAQDPICQTQRAASQTALSASLTALFATLSTPTPTTTATATATPTPTVTPTPTPSPAGDPCSLPSIQFLAVFGSTGTTNTLTAPYTGDVNILQPPGGPNFISMQQVSVQRKFVILLPELRPVNWSLKNTYMSYTEKTSTADKNPKIWQAADGFLNVLVCPGGGVALHTTGTNGPLVTFKPLAASNNPASGDLLIGVVAKIQ